MQKSIYEMSLPELKRELEKTKLNRDKVSATDYPQHYFIDNINRKYFSSIYQALIKYQGMYLDKPKMYYQNKVYTFNDAGDVIEKDLDTDYFSLWCIVEKGQVFDLSAFWQIVNEKQIINENLND